MTYAKGRLRAYLLNFASKKFIGPVEPEQARGFDADLVLFERAPNHSTDLADLKVFRECTMNSPYPQRMHVMGDGDL